MLRNLAAAHARSLGRLRALQIASTRTTDRARALSTQAACCSTPAAKRCDFFCASCGALQPAHGAACNDYELLALPVAFRVDARALEARWKALQKQLHPDRFAATGGAEAQERSAAHATRVNEAYARLRAPHTRARYLLRMHALARAQGASADGADGGRLPHPDMGDGDGGARDDPDGDPFAEGRTVADPALLMEVMEAREAVGDAEGDADALAALAARNRGAVAETEAALGDAFDGGGGPDLDAARAAAVRLQYLTKIGEEINERL